MHLPDINPILIAIGPVAIRWYALAYVAGIVLGWLYIGRLLRQESLWTPRKPPVTTDQLDDLVLWITLGVILGGRIGYILFYDASIIWRNPLQVLQIWEGGMSFHGGFLGVATAVILYCRAKRMDLAQMLNVGDLMACAAPIGLFLGRITNFINGELWGRATDAPWGMIFCNKFIRLQYGYCPAGELTPRHPSQLYEAALEGAVLFAIIWYLTHIRKEFRRPGLIAGVFIVGYGAFRTFVEFFREPDEQMLPFFKSVITMGQSLSLLMVLTGGWLIWRAIRKQAFSKQDRVA